MRTVAEPARSVPVAAECDVLVVGGGPAGFVAAAAAARLGAHVVLVERYGYLGGLATGGLVLYMDGLGDKQGTRLIGGLPWEVLERLRRLGGLASDGPLALHADSELLKVVADDLCLEAQVQLRLHSWAVAALVEEGRVIGAITESKAGRQAILARVCVDASGDGDLAALAGAPYIYGSQRIGLNLKVGGVDRERVRAFQQSCPEEARAQRAQVRALGGYPLDPNTTPHSDAGVYWVNILGLAGREREGQDEGDVLQVFGGELNALDVEDLSYAEVELRRRILRSIDFYRQNVPGYEELRLLSFASQLGVRESRCIAGVHTLTREQMLAEARFDDAIGAAGAYFCAPGRYRIPYGCLLPRSLDGLLVAGRCISVDHWAQQAIRLIPPAMVTGQAAGTAAALAVQQDTTPRALDMALLRQRLLDDGVLL